MLGEPFLGEEKKTVPAEERERKMRFSFECPCSGIHSFYTVFQLANPVFPKKHTVWLSALNQIKRQMKSTKLGTHKNQFKRESLLQKFRIKRSTAHDKHIRDTQNEINVEQFSATPRHYRPTPGMYNVQKEEENQLKCPRG